MHSPNNFKAKWWWKISLPTPQYFSFWMFVPHLRKQISPWFKRKKKERKKLYLANIKLHKESSFLWITPNTSLLQKRFLLLTTLLPSLTGVENYIPLWNIILLIVTPIEVFIKLLDEMVQLGTGRGKTTKVTEDIRPKEVKTEKIIPSSNPCRSVYLLAWWQRLSENQPVPIILLSDFHQRIHKSILNPNNKIKYTLTTCP